MVVVSITTLLFFVGCVYAQDPGADRLLGRSFDSTSIRGSGFDGPAGVITGGDPAITGGSFSLGSEFTDGSFGPGADFGPGPIPGAGFGPGAGPDLSGARAAPCEDALMRDGGRSFVDCTARAGSRGGSVGGSCGPCHRCMSLGFEGSDSGICCPDRDTILSRANDRQCGRFRSLASISGRFSSSSSSSRSEFDRFGGATRDRSGSSAGVGGDRFGPDGGPLGDGLGHSTMRGESSSSRSSGSDFGRVDSPSSTGGGSGSSGTGDMTRDTLGGGSADTTRETFRGPGGAGPDMVPDRFDPNFDLRGDTFRSFDGVPAGDMRTDRFGSTRRDTFSSSGSMQGDRFRDAGFDRTSGSRSTVDAGIGGPTDTGPGPAPGDILTKSTETFRTSGDPSGTGTITSSSTSTKTTSSSSSTSGGGSGTNTGLQPTDLTGAGSVDVGGMRGSGSMGREERTFNSGTRTDIRDMTGRADPSRPGSVGDGMSGGTFEGRFDGRSFDRSSSRSDRRSGGSVDRERSSSFEGRGSGGRFDGRLGDSRGFSESRFLGDRSSRSFRRSAGVSRVGTQLVCNIDRLLPERSCRSYRDCRYYSECYLPRHRRGPGVCCPRFPRFPRFRSGFSTRPHYPFF